MPSSGQVWCVYLCPLIWHRYVYALTCGCMARELYIIDYNVHWVHHCALLLTSHRLLQRGCNQTRQSWSPQTHTHTVTHAKTYTQKTRTLSVLIAGLSSPVWGSFSLLLKWHFPPAWERLGFPGLSGQTRGWVKILSALEAGRGPAFLYCLSVIRPESTAVSLRISLLTSFLPSTHIITSSAFLHLIQNSPQSPRFPFCFTHDYWGIIPPPHIYVCVCVPGGSPREWQWLVQ